VPYHAEGQAMLKFADLEITSVIFPAHDFSKKVVWSTTLFSIKFPRPLEIALDDYYKIGTPILSAVGNMLQADLKGHIFSVMQYIAFDPALNQDTVWAAPQKKGRALETTLAATLWTRYCILRDSFPPGTLIRVEDLLNGIEGVPFAKATVHFDGIVVLKRRFPTTKYYASHHLSTKYIYINACGAPYADVFFWAHNGAEIQELDFQTKLTRQDLTTDLLEKELQKIYSAPRRANSKLSARNVIIVSIKHDLGCEHITKSTCVFKDNEVTIGTGDADPLTVREYWISNGKMALPYSWWIAAYEHLTGEIADDDQYFPVDLQAESDDDGIIQEADEEQDLVEDD